jgi:hypothetical protein
MTYVVRGRTCYFRADVLLRVDAGGAMLKHRAETDDRGFEIEGPSPLADRRSRGDEENE